jgi:hypothetical protein
MSENRRDADTASPSGPSQGNGPSAGTGAHDVDRVEADREAHDDKAKGTGGPAGNEPGAPATCAAAGTCPRRPNWLSSFHPSFPAEGLTDHDASRRQAMDR